MTHLNKYWLFIFYIRDYLSIFKLNVGKKIVIDDGKMFPYAIIVCNPGFAGILLISQRDSS